MASMRLQVIDNTEFEAPKGFTRPQLFKLNTLYSQAVSNGVMKDRAINYGAGVAVYSFYPNARSDAAFAFLMRQISLREASYEVFQGGKGRIAQSRGFDLAFRKLSDGIESLCMP